MNDRKQSDLKRILQGFNLAPYSECEKWGVREWAVAIQFRHRLEVALRHLPWIGGPTYGPSDSQFITSSLETIRHNPTNLAYVDQDLGGMMPALRDMTVGDLLTSYNDILVARPNYLGGTTQNVDIDEDSMSQSIGDFYLQHNSYPLPDDRSAIIADLTKTNDDLIKGFKRWLHQRRANATPQIEDEWWVHFDEKTFEKWHRYRLLACIDLKLQFEAIGPFDEPDYKIIGKTIFPDSGLDQQAQIDKIRRTIWPSVDRVLDWRTLSALITHATQ